MVPWVITDNYVIRIMNHISTGYRLSDDLAQTAPRSQSGKTFARDAVWRQPGQKDCFASSRSLAYLPHNTTRCVANKNVLLSMFTCTPRHPQNVGPTKLYRYQFTWDHISV